MDEPGGAEDIHLELPAGLVEGHVLDCSVGAITGVVHQDVDAAGLGKDLLDAELRRLLIRDVHDERLHSVLAQVRHAIGTPGHAVDEEPGFLQPEGGGRSDPGGCTGDKCHLLVGRSGHCGSPICKVNVGSPLIMNSSSLSGKHPRA